MNIGMICGQSTTIAWVDAMTDGTPKFTRVSDDQLRAAGWLSSDIVSDYDSEGPYVVMRETDAICRGCRGITTGYTVFNLATASGVSTPRTHADAEAEATEEANKLNHVWLEGFAAGNAYDKAKCGK